MASGESRSRRRLRGVRPLGGQARVANLPHGRARLSYYYRSCDHRSRRPRRARPPPAPLSSAAGASGSSPTSRRSRATCATRSKWCARCRARAWSLSSRPSTASPDPLRTRSGSAASDTAPPGFRCGASTAGGSRPDPQASLRGLGALVVDLQDVGARYYTYVWTMTLAMRECARRACPLVVLDRPNPLGGEQSRGQSSPRPGIPPSSGSTRCRPATA